MTRHPVRQSARTHASNVTRRLSPDASAQASFAVFKYFELRHRTAQPPSPLQVCAPYAQLYADAVRLRQVCAFVIHECLVCNGPMQNVLHMRYCGSEAKTNLLFFFMISLSQVHFQRPFSYIHFWTPRGEFSLSIPNSSEVSANPSVSVDGASMAVHD